MRWLLTSLMLAVGGCALPPGVLFRCEVDGGCAQPDTECRDDGYCYPLDAGCTRRAPALACASLECGFVGDGCGGEIACGTTCDAPLHCEANRCALPALCTDDGWCWEHPLPQGASLRAGFSLDPRHTWFAGDTHTLLFFDSATFSLQPVSSDARSAVLALHGTSPRDVYAVGTRGLIARFTGEKWEREGALVALDAPLRAVVSLGDGGALAGTEDGRIFTRTDDADPFARWSLDAFPDAGTIVGLAVWNGAPVALTSGGQVLQRSGERWASLDAVGDAATAVLVRQGSLWVATPRSVLRRAGEGGFRSIHDAGGDALIGADAGVFLLAGDALTWFADDGAVVSTPTTRRWNAAVPWNDRLLAAGDDGALAWLSLDGGVHWRSTVPQPGALTAVCESAQRRVATGADATLWWSDAGWLPWAGDGGSWTACFGQPDRDVLALGGSAGQVLFFDGPQQRSLDTLDTAPVESLWFSADSALYATNGQRALLEWNAMGASTFWPRDLGARAPWRAISGTNAGHVFVVGDQGLISTSLLGTFASAVPFGMADWRAVSASNIGRDAFFMAVGPDGAAMQAREAQFDLVPVQPGLSLTSVWVRVGGLAFALGTDADGVAHLFRKPLGGPWSEAPLTAPWPPQAMTGTPLEDGGASLLLVGPHREILRRR